MKLRNVEPGDLEAFFQHQSDADAATLAGVPSRERAAFNVHWAQILADSAVVIRTVEEDGEVAGYIFTFIHNGERVVGYWLGREYWGRGIATEALGAFLEIVDERPLRATVAPPNRASVRVLEKNGFRLLREEPENLVFELR